MHGPGRQGEHTSEILNSGNLFFFPTKLYTILNLKRRPKDQEVWTTRGKARTWRPVEEANSRVTGLVQRVKHSMTFLLVIMMRFTSSTLAEFGTWEMRNKIFGECMGRWSKFGQFIQDTERKYHSHWRLLISITAHFPALLVSR